MTSSNGSAYPQAFSTRAATTHWARPQSQRSKMPRGLDAGIKPFAPPRPTCSAKVLQSREHHHCPTPPNPTPPHPPHPTPPHPTPPLHNKPSRIRKGLDCNSSTPSITCKSLSKRKYRKLQTKLHASSGKKHEQTKPNQHYPPSTRVGDSCVKHML